MIQLADYPVIDGFLLKTQLRCNLTFLSLAVREYEALRRSGNLRCRAWTIPNDPANQSIPARDALEYQVFMLPGSAIWGYTFLGAKGQFSFQATDSCTDVSLFSETIASSGSNRQQLLSKLAVVAEPGIMNVQICSLAASDTFGVQVILWGGEPLC
jgi:hypothetical protein